MSCLQTTMFSMEKTSSRNRVVSLIIVRHFQNAKFDAEVFETNELKKREHPLLFLASNLGRRQCVRKSLAPNGGRRQWSFASTNRKLHVRSRRGLRGWERWGPTAAAALLARPEFVFPVENSATKPSIRESHTENPSTFVACAMQATSGIGEPGRNPCGAGHWFPAPNHRACVEFLPVRQYRASRSPLWAPFEFELLS